MGNKLSSSQNSSSHISHRISFNEMLKSIKNVDTKQSIIINTLPVTDQDCLILNTLNYEDEETEINTMINSPNVVPKSIVIYGRNCNDITVITKYNQLLKLGFKDVKIYTGGLFEWLLLQIVHSEYFETTCGDPDTIDIYKYSTFQSV